MTLKDALYRLFSYTCHYLTATNTLGYGIHSPSLYYMVRFLFYDENAYYCFSSIEQQRIRLLRATKELQVEDFGTGKSGKRRLNQIAASSLMPRKDAQLLFRLVNHLKPETIIELGTSLGISTSYLSFAAPQARVLTFEGSNAVLQEAKKVFDLLQCKNVTTIEGDIDNTLPDCLKTINKLDFVVMDANHTYEATMRYFNLLLPFCHEKTILVADDIHYSVQMNRAWQQMCAAEKVTASMDLYGLGLLFFDRHLGKHQYKIRI